ncbi:hypothetical protein [Terriglobus sp.]
MPSFQHILTEPEMWQVSMLLAQANQPQSKAVTEILSQTGSGLALVNNHE